MCARCVLFSLFFILFDTSTLFTKIRSSKKNAHFVWWWCFNSTSSFFCSRHYSKIKLVCKKRIREVNLERIFKNHSEKEGQHANNERISEQGTITSAWKAYSSSTMYSDFIYERNALWCWLRYGEWNNESRNQSLRSTQFHKAKSIHFSHFCSGVSRLPKSVNLESFPLPIYLSRLNLIFDYSAKIVEN